MPKDECDPEDPMELTGAVLATEEDTLTPMAECFIEELMRTGHNARQIYALFADPQYVGPHLVFQARGETFVRRLIAKTMIQWGRRPEPEFQTE